MATSSTLGLLFEISAVAVVGLIEVGAYLVKEIVEIADAFKGLDAASVKAWDDARTGAFTAELALLSYQQRMEALNQIGLSGLDLATEKQRENTVALQRNAEAQQNAMAARDSEQAQLNQLNEKRDYWTQAQLDAIKSYGSLKNAIDEYTKSLKANKDQLKTLRKEQADFNHTALELEREATAEAAKEGEVRTKKEQEELKKGEALAKQHNDAIWRAQHEAYLQLQPILAAMHGDFAKEIAYESKMLTDEEKAWQHYGEQVKKIATNIAAIEDRTNKEIMSGLAQRDKQIIRVFEMEIEEGRKAAAEHVRHVQQEIHITNELAGILAGSEKSSDTTPRSKLQQSRLWLRSTWL